jgi:hypothetical protein
MHQLIIIMHQCIIKMPLPRVAYTFKKNRYKYRLCWLHFQITNFNHTRSTLRSSLLPSLFLAFFYNGRFLQNATLKFLIVYICIIQGIVRNYFFGSFLPFARQIKMIRRNTKDVLFVFVADGVGSYIWPCPSSPLATLFKRKSLIHIYKVVVCLSKNLWLQRFLVCQAKIVFCS